MYAPGTHFPLLAALTALLAARATSVAAQDQSADVAPECIDFVGIDGTKILDDRSILFVMRDNVVYRNTLTGSCPGLRSEDKFAYVEPRPLSPLCKGAQIVVPSFSARGARPGTACWLGAFQRLSDDEVQEIVAALTAPKKKGAGGAPAINAQPVELEPATQTLPDPAAPATKPAASTAEASPTTPAR